MAITDDEELPPPTPTAVAAEPAPAPAKPLPLVDPVFILAPPCTFSWVVCAMLGQHPQTYALPELHLFTADTMAEWLERSATETFEMDHGLVRAVAELVYGEQTEATASRARGWLRRRAHFTTGLLLEAIVERIAPRVTVEKSPSTAHSPATLQRALDMFPSARFVHLVSHPRLYCDGVIEILGDATTTNQLPPTHWLVQLAGDRGGEPDPQVAWLEANRTIAEFLRRVPKEQQRLVRGEELLGGSSAHARPSRGMARPAHRRRRARRDEAPGALAVCPRGPVGGGLRKRPLPPPRSARTRRVAAAADARRAARLAI